MPVQMPIPLFTSLPYMGPVGPSCHRWDTPSALSLVSQSNQPKEASDDH